MQAKRTIKRARGKRALKTGAIALILSLTGVLLENKPSYACSCAGLYSRVESAHHVRNASAVVFAGNVNSINQDPTFGDEVTFSLYHLNKGSAATMHSQEITLSSGEYSLGCGYRFEPNRAYFVYAHSRNGQLHTDSCSQTKPLIYAAVDIFELAMPPIP